MPDTNAVATRSGGRPTSTAPTSVPCRSAGTPIGSHDLFIADRARALALTLVTHDLRAFRRVPGLDVQDWLAPSSGPAGA
jgi:hypothetical protein